MWLALGLYGVQKEINPYYSKTASYKNMWLLVLSSLQSFHVCNSQIIFTLKFIKSTAFSQLIIICLTVTGFVKRGLPHASNSMNLEDHNSMIKNHKALKFSSHNKL